MDTQVQTERKQCTQCGVTKGIEAFGLSKRNAGGRDTWCKACKAEYYRNRRKLNPIPFLLAERKWKDSNREFMRQQERKRYELNREKEIKEAADWNKANRERLNFRNREARKTNVNVRLKDVLRSRIRAALFNPDWKNLHAVELLGCSVAEYKIYLKKQFTSEMTWANHGSVWEIDHIRPCASFNLADIHQQRECFKFLNTQPLLKKDNRSKGAKILNG